MTACCCLSDGCDNSGDENDGERGASLAAAGGLRRPAPSFSSLLGNPEDERYSLSHAWVKNGDKAQVR